MPGAALPGRRPRPVSGPACAVAFPDLIVNGEKVAHTAMAAETQNHPGPGDTVPEFEAALRPLAEGAATPDPGLTRHGWHVIGMDAVARGAPYPSRQRWPDRATFGQCPGSRRI